jgi:hypothetical protein
VVTRWEVPLDELAEAVVEPIDGLDSSRRVTHCL